MNLGPRATQEGRAQARAWIAEQYAQLGLTLQSHGYATGTNVFAEQKGSGEGVLIISSHYDTVPGSPGADDDGSGVIAGLAVAAAMSRCQSEKTIRFLSFDEEEKNMLGSRAYVKSLRDTQKDKEIIGLIQVEMIGYDKNNDGMMARVDCQHDNNRFMADALTASIQNQGLTLTPRGECQARSDHIAFWDAQIPAMVMSELFFDPDADRNPCYHRTCDTIEIMNFEYMDKMARALTHMTMGLVGAK